LEDAESDLPMLARDLLPECKEEHDRLMERVDRLEDRIKPWRVTHDVSQRLASLLTKTHLAYGRCPCKCKYAMPRSAPGIRLALGNRHSLVACISLG
jgi:hypothetical protein